MKSEKEVRAMLASIRAEKQGQEDALNLACEIFGRNIPVDLVKTFADSIGDLQQAEYLLQVVLGDLPVPTEGD